MDAESKQPPTPIVGWTKATMASPDPYDHLIVFITAIPAVVLIGISCCVAPLNVAYAPLMLSMARKDKAFV